jgi:hypothetical protein
MLKQLLEEARFAPAASTSTTPEMLAALQASLHILAGRPARADSTVMEQLQEMESLALGPAETNLLYFCDRLLETCDLHNDIDEALFPAFMKLRPRIASVLLAAPNPDLLMQHPFFELLDSLWCAARYWGQDLGKAGDRYRARIENMLTELCDTETARASYIEWRDRFRLDWQKDMQKGAMLAERIAESERRTLAAQHAERVVHQQVNALLQYSEMPEVVEAFIKELVRHTLQVVMLAHGTSSEVWQAAINAVHRLQDSMRAPQDESEKQRTYKLIPLLPDMLRHTMIGVGDAVVLEAWLEQIEDLHMQILLGKSVELRPATQLEQLVTAPAVQTEVSSALLDQVMLIPVGSWVVYLREDGEPQRCRLVLKLDEIRQLLFVNVLGAKTLELSFEDFACLLSGRHVRLLDEDLHFHDFLHETLMQLRALSHKQKLLQADADARAAVEAERRRVAVEKARREAEVLEGQRREREAREAAAVAAVVAQQREREAREAEAAAKVAAAQQAEQVRAAELAERMAVQQRAADESAAQQQVIDQAEDDAQSLVVGAWVEMTVGGVRQKAKLAAVLRGEKLIFTDRAGKKLLECTRAELKLQLLENTAVIIETGKQFESSLQKVIQTLRKD